MNSHVFKNPNHYSLNNALQIDFAFKLLAKVTILPNASVLDIGCGDGLIPFEISKIAVNGCTIATDISAEMIGFATKRYDTQRNLRFLQMDGAKNIFRNQFDVITSFNALHWVKDQAAAINGIASAAAENATIALLLSHKKSIYHHVLESTCQKPRWKEYFKDYKNPRSFFDFDEYKKLILNSGLNIIEFAEEEMTYQFKNRTELKDFFKASMANIKQIPAASIDDFLEDFCDEFISSVKCSLHTIPVSFWCLQIIATQPPKPLSEKSIDTDRKKPAIRSNL